MKTFTARIDDEMDRFLDQLRSGLRLSSKADVFRFGVSLMAIALEASKKGLRFAVVDDEGNVEKEILAPWSAASILTDRGEEDVSGQRRRGVVRSG